MSVTDMWDCSRCYWRNYYAVKCEDCGLSRYISSILGLSAVYRNLKDKLRWSWRDWNEQRICGNDHELDTYRYIQCNH